MQMSSSFTVHVLSLWHVFMQRQRWRPYQERQISWDARVKVEEAPEYERGHVHEDQSRWKIPANLMEAAKHPPRQDKHEKSLKSLLCYLVGPLLLVVAVVVAIVVAFSVLKSPSGESTLAPNTDVNDGGVFVEQYNPDLVEVPSLPPRRRSAAVWTMNPREDRLLPTSNQDPLSITTDYMLITPSVLHFDAAVSETIATRFPSAPKRRRNVCLRASSKLAFGSPEVNTRLSEAHQNCDVLIHCCNFVRTDPSVEDWIITGGEPTAGELPMARNGDPLKNIILGVHVGDDAAFERLLFNWSGELTKFLAGIIHTAQMGRFSGVRLWVPLQGNATSGFGDRLIGLARTVARKLRGVNCTFGFFLPKDILLGHLGITTAELTKALDAPHSLLVYPQFPAFGTATASTPGARSTAEEVLAHASVETGAMQNSKSICYLPPPPVAMHAHLAESCDPSKPPVVSRLTYLNIPMLNDVCRTLRLDDSWTSSAHKYHTFACKGSLAVLYETPQQTQQFCDDFFAAAPLSTCLASFVDLEGLPGGCHEIYSGLGEPATKIKL
ncbi:hypothetical protein HPB48_008352 [Haemaphysalis longicornis]|uniref:Uncharacterized protein n=1 Tax=Haemaphysalis longicornis TaxID=44386 RepID=A0A9J6FZR9_HAELO|nr:hypothetical protein HPB48_008352 [Haemaphysalis longicornis]